eukprot:jgi/Botrbrau1/9054/Bobra.0376s0028.1
MGTEGSDGRRPKRRCTKTAQPSHMPSAVHYVGYVEDDETPEMIMKKFEELEKVKRMTCSDTVPDINNEGGSPTDAHFREDSEGDAKNLDGKVLSEAQLLQVFKQTSIFNVRSALQGNDVLMAHNEAPPYFGSDGDSSGEDELWGDLRGFWSDEDDQDFTDHWKQLKKHRKGPSTNRAAGRTSHLSSNKVTHEIVTHYNSVTQALIRRKVRRHADDSLCQIKVPYPLPVSWGRTVAPYIPAHKLNQGSGQADENVSGNGSRPGAAQYYETASIIHFNFRALSKGSFQGVLINKGWEVEGARGEAVTSRLADLPLQRICPVGFVFIWTEKQHMAAVVDLMDSWGYSYVENLTWVYLAANNTILTVEAPYAQRSHLTLFIFRREGEGRDIELRHQRNPDVIFDCLRHVEGQGQANPEEVFLTIETLLPTGKGALLELFAPLHAHREGWVHIAQIRKS